MKKLLTIVFALMFTTTVAFAQSGSAIVTQNGNNSDATVTQTNNSSNTLLEAVINQSGGSNDADVIQFTSSIHGVVDVDQTLGNAVADVDQKLMGTGKDVTATVKQAGNNLADVDQGQTGKMSNSGLDLTQRNTAEEGQGFMNEANVYMLSGGSDVNILQEGTDNYLDYEQQYGVNQDATVEQLGEGNDAYVYQDNFDFGNTAKVEMVQDGDNNMVRIDQEDRGKANIDQLGNDNILRGLDGVGDIALQGSDSELNLTQNASNNLAEVEQGMGATATIDQLSNGNVATVDQNGASTTTITQN